MDIRILGSSVLVDSTIGGVLQRHYKKDNISFSVKKLQVTSILSIVQKDTFGGVYTPFSEEIATLTYNGVVKTSAEWVDIFANLV